MSGTTPPGAPPAHSSPAFSLLGFPPSAYLALLLIALGTLAGAWSVRRWPHRRPVLMPAACGVLLALAGVDILPHALDDADAAGLPAWAVAAAGAGGFVVVPACGALLTRWGRGRAHGAGTAAALVLHRVIEGMTVVLLPTPPVVAALVVHSASEGLALTALLESDRRRRLAPWLTVACLSPLLGGWLTEVVPLPEGAHAVLMGLVAGVLLRGATAAAGLVRDGRTVTRAGVRLTALALGSAMAVTTVALLVLH